MAAVLFEPFDTVDKIKIQLMHHKFNGVKILLTVKAPGQIVPGVDGGVGTLAHRAVERGLSVVVAGGNRKHGFNDAVYRDLVAQKR